MNKYESIIIMKAEVNEDQMNESINKFKELMKNVEIEDLKIKKLAYELKGNKERTLCII